MAVIRRIFSHTLPTDSTISVVDKTSIDLSPYVKYINSLKIISVTSTDDTKIDGILANSDNIEAIEAKIKDLVEKGEKSIPTKNTTSPKEYNIRMVIQVEIPDEEYLSNGIASIKLSNSVKDMLKGYVKTEQGAHRIVSGWIKTTDGLKQIFSKIGGAPLEEILEDQNAILMIGDQEWVPIGASTNNQFSRIYNIINNNGTISKANTHPDGIIFVRRESSVGNVVWRVGEKKLEDTNFFESGLFSRMTDTFFALDIGINKLAIPVAFSDTGNMCSWNGYSGLQNCCYTFVLRPEEITEEIKGKIIINSDRVYWLRDKSTYGKGTEPGTTGAFFHPCLCLDKKTAIIKQGVKGGKNYYKLSY